MVLTQPEQPRDDLGPESGRRTKSSGRRPPVEERSFFAELEGANELRVEAVGFATARN